MSFKWRNSPQNQSTPSGHPSRQILQQVVQGSSNFTEDIFFFLELTEIFLIAEN